MLLFLFIGLLCKDKDKKNMMQIQSSKTVEN